MENLNGTIEALRKDIATLDGKISLIHTTLTTLVATVAMQEEALKDVKCHGLDIARLDTYVKITWAIVIIILGMGATVIGRLLIP